ncbi:Dolichyl-diphosphooligosaccharide-protein glycosyltransferase subunit dad1 [Exophiala sideris]|uniref:DASH complex subunit DAD1 n=1 Tax=Exophiala sideris TaxID=1016849 RepID=A0ABR0JN45_9EURO|nr:Dolichyl-diphosphooligosaccharide-protein glycosyltransferase subunit dad1 [Exophiala sideris]KAK5067067.1 Dolichyl-diphosphooligosaccharide-protein glycosyltransferase subunit dad1 [Exophiala sideris]
MATLNNHASDASQSSEFEQRRAALVSDIGEPESDLDECSTQSLEQVLTHVNALNRSLEGIIEIGNEFASVEALWSQFETVMGRDNETPQDATGHDGDGEVKTEPREDTR